MSVILELRRIAAEKRAAGSAFQNLVVVTAGFLFVGILAGRPVQGGIHPACVKSTKRQMSNRFLRPTLPVM